MFRQCTRGSRPPLAFWNLSTCTLGRVNSCFFLKGIYGMLMDFYGILWEFHEFCRIEWKYAGIFTGFMLIWNIHEYTGITTW